MSKIGIFISKMNSYILHKHGHKNPLLQIRYGIGLVYNYLRYEATISDYFELSFYEKRHKEKDLYITSPQAFRFAEFVDSLPMINKYFSKSEMYRALGTFINRKQLFTKGCSFEDFTEFVQQVPQFIYKPDKDDCGHGVELWSVNKENCNEKYLKAVASPAVLDEPVVQSPIMSKFNPSSVNTIRLYSLIIEAKCVFFAGFLRMGRNGSLVDNLGSGGLLAGIDVTTGEVITPATDDTGHCFEKHPDTNTQIVGFQIPMWKELLEFTEKAALCYPMKYVGWDIAICADGFQIIEANPDPMIHGIQTNFFGGRKAQYKGFEEIIRQERNRCIGTSST